MQRQCPQESIPGPSWAHYPPEAESVIPADADAQAPPVEDLTDEERHFYDMHCPT